MDGSARAHSSADSTVAASGVELEAPSEIATSRWAFLADDVDFWLDHVRISDSRHATPNQLWSFTAFDIYLPSCGSIAVARRLGSATELVCLMLCVDPTAWRFLLKQRSPSSTPFDVTAYDQSTLVPKIVFHGEAFKRSSGIDAETAARLLKTMLCDEVETNAVLEAKARIDGYYDRYKKLDSIEVPVELTIGVWSHPILQAVADIIEAVQTKGRDSSRVYPFVLAEVRLAMSPDHLNLFRRELRSLCSFRIPVRVAVWDCHREFAENHANEYTAFAENPSPLERELSRSVVSYDLRLNGIDTSSEFWSALAYIPNVQYLSVRYQYHEDHGDRMAHARWFAYALRQGGVKALILDEFEPTPDELDVIRTMACAANPARLLKQTADSLDGSSVPPQVVTLKKDAPVRTAAGDTKSLKELCVPMDWRFPVVDINEELKTIDFVVPGFAICSTTLASVSSIDEVPQATAMHDTTKHGLETLDVTSPFNWHHRQSGAAATLVELFGRSLRELRWKGSVEKSFEGDFPFDEDLARILAVCPDLESVTLKSTRMLSLQALQDHYSSHPCLLRELQLDDVPIPSAELVKFFTHLADSGNRLARTLQRLKYTSRFYPEDKDDDDDVTFHGLDPAAIDAALAMLSTNRTLSYVSFEILNDFWDAHHQRFDAHRGVVVKIDRLPIHEKLAFLSVVQTHDLPSDCAIGRLESLSITQIFEFFTKTVIRELAIEEHN